jgi:hypothetical protein
VGFGTGVMISRSLLPPGSFAGAIHGGPIETAAIHRATIPAAIVRRFHGGEEAGIGYRTVGGV